MKSFIKQDIPIPRYTTNEPYRKYESETSKYGS